MLKVNLTNRGYSAYPHGLVNGSGNAHQVQDRQVPYGSD